MAKVSLVDVDSKIPNLALMKISAYHKKNGDNVEWHQPLFSNSDITYMSKVFDYTEDYPYPINADKIYKGGTGYDLTTKLPSDIEKCRPDYSIYPDCDYAMGFTTRGCIRNCSFCVVPEKEGKIRAVADIYDFWNGQDKIKLLDNNLTAHDEHFGRILKQIIKENIKISFDQGLDIRLLTEKKADLLSKVKLWKNLKFAWDLMGIEKQVKNGLKLLRQKGFTNYRKLLCYVLIGFNTTPEEDLYRVRKLKEWGASPFAMPYDKTDPYQKKFSRWVNHKAIFNSVSWENYKSNQRKSENKSEQQFF